jgi:cell division protein ZapA
MGDVMPSVNVTINGKSYRLACDEGQEAHLLALADEINGHIEGFKGSFGEIGDGRLTVMAALMVADQLSEMRRRMAEMEVLLAAERAANAEAARRFEGAQDQLAEALTAAAERVERLTASLGVRGD